MALAIVNIGSNLGDRKKHLLQAISCIGEMFGTCCLSDFIESEPWGFGSDNKFMNVGVSFHTDFSPEKLLSHLQAIEKKISGIAHRDKYGNYKDREIDIDIMAIDEIVYHSDILDVPHLHLSERDFFLQPLYQLKPDWKNPRIQVNQKA